MIADYLFQQHNMLPSEFARLPRPEKAFIIESVLKVARERHEMEKKHKREMRGVRR